MRANLVQGPCSLNGIQHCLGEGRGRYLVHPDKLCLLVLCQ